MASLDMAGNQSPDDLSSTLSINSEQSSESDLVLLPDPDPIESTFCNVEPVEEAAECTEEENTVTSPSEKDSFSASLKRHDLVRFEHGECC